MPAKEHLNPESMSQPTGYSQVVKVGDTVYIAGQVGGKGDAEAQVRQVWRSIEAAVQSVGGTLQDVVKTTTYVTSIDHAGAVRTVRDELFKTVKPPTSTLLVVSALASPDYVVEIEAVAVV